MLLFGSIDKDIVMLNLPVYVLKYIQKMYVF